jgi:hypothetical protein
MAACFPCMYGATLCTLGRGSDDEVMLAGWCYILSSSFEQPLQRVWNERFIH